MNFPVTIQEFRQYLPGSTFGADAGSNSLPNYILAPNNDEKFAFLTEALDQIQDDAN
jgi:hypothetical protein